MYSKNLGAFVWYGFGLVLLTLATFAALKWLQIPSGRMIDWIIGVLSFWWLLIISTVPWNTYFEAKAVLAEAEQSTGASITVDQSQLGYVNTVSKRALIVAIALHIISAAVLFALSATGISPVGYVASSAALLLTILRPSVRAYEYLWQRLAAIRHQVRFPRQDVVLLDERVKTTETEIENLEHELDQKRAGSFAYEHQQTMREIKHLLDKLTGTLEEFEHQNRIEHDQLGREARSGIAKISADTQFLDHVREIVRMIKTA